MDEHVGGGTIKNRADEAASKHGLLLGVLVSRDLWSIDIVGPRVGPGIRHGLDVYGGGQVGMGVGGQVWGDGAWGEQGNGWRNSLPKYATPYR